MSIEAMEDFSLENPSLRIKDRLNGLLEFARGLSMKSEEAFSAITSLYSDSKNWEKRIEFARKEANEPDQTRINARNDKAKELLGPLKEIQHVSKLKAEEYQKLLESVKKEEEEKIREAIDMLGIEDMPYLAPLDKSIRTEKAMVYTRTVRKFRIVDQSKVPSKYLKVNEDMVKEDMELGINEIPGIEFYEEQTTTLRTR